MASICGPPPCTTTGRTPIVFSSTTSRAKEARRSSSVMRVAAVLDDDGLVDEAPDVGQRLDEHLGLVDQRLHAPPPRAPVRAACLARPASA